MAQILVGMEENQHMAQCDIQVHPDHRRKGLGKTLLSHIAEFCHQHQRGLLIFPTDSLVPAGEDFIRSIGGMLGLAQTINQLSLKEVNLDLLQRWQQKGRQQCPDYEIGTWVGAVPEEHLDAYVAIKNVMNTAPKDDLDVEDIFITAEQVRQMEAMESARGITRWTMYVRNPENGEIAGFTEVTANPSTPQTLTQGDTGVSPKYRARGIGRWLKAAMVDALLQEHPQALRIRTGNATTNEPMLRINAEMGFTIYKTIDFWQVKLDKVDTYLSTAQE